MEMSKRIDEKKYLDEASLDAEKVISPNVQSNAIQKELNSRQ